MSRLSPLAIEDRKEAFRREEARHRDNARRLTNCPGHRFSAATDDQLMASPYAKPFECRMCGGRMSLHDLKLYLQGFKAAGGDPERVLPGAGDWLAGN
jgi:hypothetical protein